MGLLSVARRFVIPAAVALAAALPNAAAAQTPAKFENLKVFPKDIPRDSLLGIMRYFTGALGVRCQYCHVERPADASAPNGAPGGGPGGGLFARFNFPLDDKVTKQKARFMLRMTDSLNRVVLAALPERRDPPVRVECVTCHRGNPVPQTTQSALAQAIDKFGADSAIALYRRLRTDMASGRYDLSEMPVNDLARSLDARGKSAEAIAMLQMNQEFYPNSAEIDAALGEIYLKQGNKDQAIARFRAALTKRPNDPRLRQRLQELGVSPNG